MTPWQAFTHRADYPFDAQRVSELWPQLHRGDALACPSDPALLQAWALFHSGAFEEAASASLRLADAGNDRGRSHNQSEALTLANKATCIYANYLEPREARRLALFTQVAERAGAQAAQEPNNASAHYWQAYALGRYSQGISVAKALALGLGARVKAAFEKTIELAPTHADAHVGLASFHAEVIDKVGPLVGGMTYGAKKELGLALFEKALQQNPSSAIARIEYARGLLMLAGNSPQAQGQSQALYEQAVRCTPLDAEQRLDVDMARTELAHA